MVILLLAGPAVLTVGFFAAVYWLLALAGIELSRRQLVLGSLFFYLFWQTFIVWRLWKQW
jgi:hypothetical protein